MSLKTMFKGVATEQLTEGQLVTADQLVRVPAGRSPKHYINFKYTHNAKVFNGLGDNRYEMRKFKAELEARRAQGEHIEIQRIKQFYRLDRTNPRHPYHECFSIHYYTRKFISRKQAISV